MLELPPPPAFLDNALCAQVDNELFYPEKGGSTRLAKAVCARCEVRLQCLLWALDHDDRYGIWGGYSERERRRIKADPELREHVVALLTDPDHLNPRHVRAWAAAVGVVVAARGRIPDAIKDLYRKKHAA